MKKLFLMFLILILSFNLIACSSLKEEAEIETKGKKQKVEETEPESTDPDATEEPKATEKPKATEPKATEPKPIIPTDPPAPEPTEVLLRPEDNYYENPEPEYYEEDSVVLNPVYVYWGDDGRLYTECEIINTYDSAITDIDIYYFAIYNSDGIVAEGDFGILPDLTLESGYYDTWTLWFEPDAIAVYGADIRSMEYYYEYEASYV